MAHVSGTDRTQVMFTSLDAMVAQDSEARLIDLFVDGLDLEGLGFGGRPRPAAAAKVRDAGQAALFEAPEPVDAPAEKPTREGRPSYDPRAMLKLYVYGNCNQIRSSRRLERACETNVEVMWLVEGVRPDFRTIARFRRENATRLKGVFREFGRAIREAVAGAVDTRGAFESVDGSKVRACCSKMANFTAGKLDDRIAWLEAHADEYLRMLDEADEGESGEATRELLEAKAAEASERLEYYRGLLETLEESGESQVSVTDADARLMKSKQGFVVAYNPQTAVNSATHLIDSYEMTNAPTDHGQLLPTLAVIAEGAGGIVEATADKGYQQDEDMIACLEKGVLPHVICSDGEDGHDLEVAYVEPEEEPDPTSCDPEEISRCLHAGVVPDAYAHAIEGMEVARVRRRVVDEEPRRAEAAYGSPEEMEARAREGYFVRDPGRNLVWCPNGERLRQKSVERGGAIRYANKMACKRCPLKDRCLGGKQTSKEIGFTKDQLEKPCGKWHEAQGTEPDKAGVGKGRYHYETVAVVRFRLRPDIVKTSQRMGTSEHPFGTIKRDLGADHFLLRGMENVDGEFALMCLAYNFRRAKNILGFDGLREALAA